MGVIRDCVLMLLLTTGAFACIGNPNGVSLSFPSNTINMEKAYEFCETTTCLERESSILYLTVEGLAVSIYENKLNIEIPITEEGQPVLNFTNWKSVVGRELTKLSEYGILNLTRYDIDKIINSKYVKPGAILIYEKKVGTVDEKSADIVNASNAEVQIAKGTRGSNYCSGPPILVNELPKQETGESDIQLPFRGYQTAVSHEEPSPTSSGVKPVERPSVKDQIYKYWWVPLLIFAVVFLVFKLQLGGKEEEMSPEDLIALSAPRRIGMMKSLTERRKTLTELSKEANISLPTAKEHLEKLEKSGLVRKIDTGHKWKYYELTKKGRRIVESADLNDN